MMWLAVGVGGALGALMRALGTDLLGKYLPRSFPWPTLIINSTACFLMGVASSLVLTPFVSKLIIIGFLGAFSTMSTLSYEAVDLVVKHKFVRSLVYLVVSYGCALLATTLGYVCSLYVLAW